MSELKALAERCRPAVARDAKLRDMDTRKDLYAASYRPVLEAEAQRAQKLLDDIDAIIADTRSERTGWIAVTERLPTHVYSVLIRVTGGTYHHDEDYTEIGIYLNGIWRHEADGDDMPIMVSHWMLLPEAPK